MASWMVHLRIADKLLNQLPDLSPTEFVVGNIAPDSGVPNEDWSVYTPSKVVSHFKGNLQAPKDVHIPSFVAQYFTPELRKRYNKEEYSFFLGYLTHLLTDRLWSERIARPAKARCNSGDPAAFMWRVKEDWYDLDYLYLREHPNFRAFSIYEKAVGFENTFMDIFAPDAFDNRRQYITEFYRKPNDHLDRIYPYLTEAEADAFVNRAAEEILEILQKEYC